MTRSTRGALAVLAAFALALAAAIVPTAAASAVDWSVVPGAGPDDLIVTPYIQNAAQTPGFSYTARTSGIADYCAATDPAGRWDCPTVDYRTYFTLTSATVTGAIATVTLIPTVPVPGQTGLTLTSMMSDHWEQVFTSGSDGWVYYPEIIGGRQVGQLNEQQVVCAVGVPCTVKYGLNDDYTRFTGDKWLAAQVGGAQIFIPLSGQTTTATPPTAAFAATFTGSHAWSFDASASTAVTGQTVRSYRWTFGDGQTATTTTPTTTHTYADSAARTASLVVVDSAGTASGSISHTLTEPNLVVNSTGDRPATDPRAGCDTGATIASGATECTLRAAIQALDAGSSSTTITFSLPAGSTTITAASALPDITRAHATVQGSTGATMPVISGSGLHVVNAAGVRISAVSVISPGDDGVRFEKSPDATLTSSLIGVSPTGQVSAPRWGVDASTGGAVTIGGSGSAGNVIVGTIDGLTLTPSTPITSLTVAGNSIGETAQGALLSGPSPVGWGIGLFAGTTTLAGATVSGNRVAGFGVNVVLMGRGIASPTISGNTIGVAPDQDSLLGQSRVNLRLDGVPHARVENNQLAGGTYDVLVSGSVQASVAPVSDGEPGTVVVHLRYPGDSDVVVAAVTGTGTAITGNRIGPVSRHAGSPTDSGITVWNAGDGTTITGNTILDHQTYGIDVLGSGVGSALNGTVASGTLVHGTVITGNTIGAAPGNEAGGYGIRLQDQSVPQVTQNTIGGIGTAVSIAATNVASLVTGNTIGLWTDGVTADRVLYGVYVSAPDTTVGPGNTIGNATGAGIDLEAAGARVVGNRIGAARFGSGAAPDAIGVLVDTGATGAVVGGSGSGNVIAGNPIGVKLVEAGAEIAANTFGLLTGTTRGNATAVAAGANASIHDNTIAGSTAKGITVGATAVVKIVHNSIYGTADAAGIDTHVTRPLVLAAPRVTHGTSTRTWLLLSDVPTQPGTIEVFGNPSCSDPEGRVPLFTTPTTSSSSRVLSVVDRADQAGFTVTVTTAAGTTQFSNCQTASSTADTDGDGIPDLVEVSFPGAPTSAAVDTQSAFIGDNQQWVVVTALTGHLRNVAPLDDPDPSGHPGVSFPMGLIDWTVTGIDPGSFARVGFSLPGTAVTAWWKYSSRHAPQFFDFAYSPIKGYGAILSNFATEAGPSTAVVESVPDGGEGDDDGLENGSVHDPVAPAIVKGAIAPAPSDTSAQPGASTLAATGSDGASDALPVAAATLAGGLALLLVRRRRRLRSGR